MGESGWKSSQLGRGLDGGDGLTLGSSTRACERGAILGIVHPLLDNIAGRSNGIADRQIYSIPGGALMTFR